MVRLPTQLGLLLGRDVNLGTVMERLAAVYGDRPLVEQAADEKAGAAALSLTYAGAEALVERWADGIAAAAAIGDRVVIALPNGYAFFLACLAASRAGTIAVPVNPQMRPAEIDHVIDDSGATLVMRDVDELPVGATTTSGRRPTGAPDDVAAIFYTSGTTGKPKGVRLTHRSLAGQVRGLGLPSHLRTDEAVFGLPVAHIMGFVGLLGLASAGISAYVLPRFRPLDVLDAIETRRSSMFIGVPAMYRLLLEAGAEQRDLRSIRLFASGADVMPPELAARFQKMGALAEVPLLGPIGEAIFAEGYGMVETGGGVAGKVRLPLPFVGDLLGDAMGIPIPPYRLKVVRPDGTNAKAGEVGELLVKGPGTLQGYHGAPEATAAILTDDGWLRTGDLARTGAFGTIIFAGRAKDVIKQGGYSVYSLEVEKALEEHPAVAEASVLGIPDERVGERVVAVVRIVEGATVDGPAIVAFAREHLSEYKVPTEVRIVDELPRTGTEKVQKNELRKLFTE